MWVVKVAIIAVKKIMTRLLKLEKYNNWITIILCILFVSNVVTA